VRIATTALTTDRLCVSPPTSRTHNALAMTARLTTLTGWARNVVASLRAPPTNADVCVLFVSSPTRRSMIHSASAYPRLQARVKRTIAYTPTDDGTAGFPTVCDSFKPLGRHSV
jgi:hypothetical protein